MKTIKHCLPVFLTMLFAVLTTVTAQKTGINIKAKVESKTFVFIAQTASPMRGGIQQLSTGYDLSINPGTVTAYLPFYGRAQGVTIGTSGNGIKFTSTDFQYENVAKNKSWKITIKPNDVSQVREFNLTIFDNGSATLDVINLNRDNISFSGYIR